MSTGPKYFSSAAAFRVWMVKHHATATELHMGFVRRHTGVPGITWPESVRVALCFGWIDGVRRRIDDDRYSIRFTARRMASTWSKVNIRMVAELEEAGEMTDAGRAAFARRIEKRSGIYAYERAEGRPDLSTTLDPAGERAFMKERRAWDFFRVQAPSYQRKVAWWVGSAKREATRTTRLAKAITASAEGRRLG